MSVIEIDSSIEEEMVIENNKSPIKDNFQIELDDFNYMSNTIKNNIKEKLNIKSKNNDQKNKITNKIKLILEETKSKIYDILLDNKFIEIHDYDNVIIEAIKKLN